uniref:Uncharacterized protein n=1 Tax=Strombidium rassoulzadegani TaxID=1082188 RepID=A0A7S3CLY6_9SPIT|mmetsp:Transcript_16534/g.28096  ORF Transcript_16534/g.28096 Transcript_16534/m.28096 type:complete len:218 (+) Transcript_16534:801-1454(+)
MFTALTYNFGDLRSKLNSFVALAPVLQLGNSPNKLLRSMVKKKSQIRDVCLKTNFYEFLGNGYDKAGSIVCLYLPCELFDYIDPKYNRADAAQLSRKRPSSNASLKQLVHFAQLMKDKKFELYNYETTAKNRKLYGSRNPPIIDIKKIKDVPIAMFVGKQDELANPTDARWARDQLKSEMAHYEEIDQFDHSSFNIGKDLSYFERVISVVKVFNPLL